MKRTVSSLASYINGYPFKPAELGRDGTPVVRIKQLLDASAETDRSTRVIPQRFIISNGDLILSWSGTLAVRVWDRGSAYLNQHLFRVQPGEGVERDWLKYALQQAIVDLSSHMHGSAMTHITRDMMQAVSLELPSPDEQRRIADFLDDRVARIDHIIRARRSQIMNLSAILRARLELSLATALESGSLPLRAVATVVAGKSQSDREGPFPLIGANGEIGSSVSPNIITPVVVVGRVGSCGTVHRVTRPAWISDNALIVSPNASGGYGVDGLAAVLEASRLPSLASSTAQPLITGAQLKSVRVPHSDQVSAVIDAYALVEEGPSAALARQITLLQEYKQSLITAAVTGEFDVTTASTKIPEN